MPPREYARILYEGEVLPTPTYYYTYFSNVGYGYADSPSLAVDVAIHINDSCAWKTMEYRWHAEEYKAPVRDPLKFIY